MKKLMMLAVWVCMTLTVQTVFAEASYTLSGLGDYAGWSAYMILTSPSIGFLRDDSIDVNASREYAKLFNDGFVPESSEGTWKDYYEGVSAMMAADTDHFVIGADGKGSFVLNEAGATDAYLMCIVALFEDGITSGSDYKILMSRTGQALDGDNIVANPPYGVDFSNNDLTYEFFSGTLHSDTGGSSVPEPTSGLLLLLGVAGLALKRKQRI